MARPCAHTIGKPVEAHWRGAGEAGELAILWPETGPPIRGIYMSGGHQRVSKPQGARPDEGVCDICQRARPACPAIARTQPPVPADQAGTLHPFDGRQVLGRGPRGNCLEVRQRPGGHVAEHEKKLLRLKGAPDAPAGRDAGDRIGRRLLDISERLEHRQPNGRHSLQLCVNESVAGDGMGGTAQ